jgi:hypothetical protein
MQVGLDKQSFSQLQSQALVLAGQTSLNFCTNNKHLIINLIAVPGMTLVNIPTA